VQHEPLGTGIKWFIASFGIEAKIMASSW